ncbi:MAG: DEAD/DEAH box helicase [Proteobacteria bacterium]|nr:DEAD/DEAH box helicase [Pseudomonadota bacterium]
MAFKSAAQVVTVPDSPEKLLLNLPRRKIAGVLLHQGEVMRNYASKEVVSSSDVALELPTGSGKTLVGLLIGEWRRLKFSERVVYLCPTKQLVNQVVEQAQEQYGLHVNGFTGSSRDYSPKACAEYRQADAIAITTYSSLFNTNPFFSNADVVIMDDAHAAENYISTMWSLRVESKDEYKALFTAIATLLEPIVGSMNFSRMMGNWNHPVDKAWVDKIPTPSLAGISNELTAILDTFLGGTELSKSDAAYSWGLLRGHLKACQLYASSQEILIRPLIPPTWTHSAFNNAKQRIFMSATLGEGGDLERVTGRKNIKRLAVPAGWDKQGIGRRYFVFPEMSLNTEQSRDLRQKLMAKAGRSLVLVPNERVQQKIASEVSDGLGYPIFSARDIEESKKSFTTIDQAVAIVANRYDGIDFPGNDCRLLFVDGLPRATNLQENFFMTRMGANILLNERVQTRVLQAIGRCTRSLQDFSAVVVTGGELPDYLTDRRKREHFPPELQAELEFGINQSKATTTKDLLENFGIFIENKQDWEIANKQILAARDSAVKVPLPALAQLQMVVNSEIDFQSSLWQEDFESALAHARAVLASLTTPELRGYRALWHYLAGSAAYLGSKPGINQLEAQAREQFSAAKAAAQGIPWLVSLSASQAPLTTEAIDDNVLFHQLERVELILQNLGNQHDLQFNKHEKEILDSLSSAKGFEQAQVKLGELLGYQAGKIENDASPDPWWIADEYYFIFEDHAGANATSVLDATKARQVATHPNWVKQHLNPPTEALILPILVSPVKKATSGASPHLIDVSYWTLEDFHKWVRSALLALREVRKTFVEPGDLIWRAQAMPIFKRASIDAPSLYKQLKAKSAKDCLIIVP